MAEAGDIIGIGIAYDTSQVVTGTRQVEAALRQVDAASKASAQQTAAQAQASTQAAAALGQEGRAALTAATGVQGSAQAARTAATAQTEVARASQQASQALTQTSAQSQQTARAQQQVAQAGAQSAQALRLSGAAAQQAHGAMAQLTSSLTSLVAGALAFQTLRTAIEGVVQAALKMEALTAAFTAITGSAKGAAEALAFVRETAGRLGVGVTDLASSYKTLLSATEGTKLSGEAVRTLFLGITEAGRAVGLSSQEIAGAIRPIGQILNQQAIQGDEWRTEFGTRIPQAMQLLLAATNGAVKTTGELTKAMEEGKLKGDVVFDIMNNIGELLRNKYAPAAMAAAQGTQASFERLQTAVTELQTAIGQGLNPALAEGARALTAFITMGKEGAGAFGGQFTEVIRQMTSALIGLAGGAILAGKAVALLGVAFTFDYEAVQAGKEDIRQFASDLVDVQTKLLSGGFAATPGAPMAAPAATLRPITLAGGTEKAGGRGRSDEEKEAARAASTRLSLQQQIADAYEKELYPARELQKIHLERAGFDQAHVASLMQQYDDTQGLAAINKEEEQRLQERAQLDRQLSEALDKQNLTERELFQKKLLSLHYTKEESDARLTLYDREKAIREEKERQVELERDAVQATKEHEAVLARLMEQLEPRRRRMSRQEQLQETMSDLAGTTSDPFTLAQADLQRQRTLAIESTQEEWERWASFGEDALAQVGDAITQFAFHGKMTFKDMANSIIEDFFRLSLQSVAKMAFQGDWLSGLLKAGTSLLNAFGDGGGTLAINPGNVPTGWSVVTPKQRGGPVSSGQPYVVGEGGPELFVPRQSGMIVPQGQSLAAPTVIVNVHGVRDAQSFVASRGAVQRGIAGAVSQAYRGL